MEASRTLSPRRRNLIFINVMLSCIASSMLATALNTALPPILNDFHITADLGQWLTSGYSLMMAIVMPLTAFLINRFPTRKLYITALLIFLSGLGICAVSTGFVMMMIGRLIQAAGNGMLTSMTQVIILSIFPDEQKGTAMGWYGLSVGAAPVLAPTLAGVIVDLWGWRMIFIASAVIMLVSLAWAICVFQNVLDTEKKSFDLFSFVLSSIAFGGITLAIGNVSSWGVSSPAFLLCLLAGCIAGVLFICRQLHQDEPFLDLRILKDKNYAISVFGSMLLYFIMMGSSILLPLYVQEAMGLSATVSGLVTLPGSLAMAILSPMAGRIYDKIGIKPLMLLGSGALLLSNLGMSFITAGTSVWFASFMNVIRSVAIGCLQMPLVTWGAGRLAGKQTAHGTALLTSLRTISGAIGSSVFVAVMTIASASEGVNASVGGVRTAFIWMAVSSVLLIALALFCTKKTAKPEEVRASA